MVIDLVPTAALKPYIYEYTTLKKDLNSPFSYFVFPQKGSSLAFFNGVHLLRDAKHLQIERQAAASTSVEVLGKYRAPIQLSYPGWVQEIGINFKPLGINYFFNESYQQLAPETFQPLLHAAWTGFADQLFQLEDLKEQIAALEAFLLQRLQGQKVESLSVLERAALLLEDQDQDWSIADIAGELQMTEKTLVRQFKKYAGCSPIQLKRILRFRRSINLRQVSDTAKNLTDTALEGLFYDSSHFAREYRLLTGESPKSFFKEVSF